MALLTDFVSIYFIWAVLRILWYYFTSGEFGIEKIYHSILLGAVVCVYTYLVGTYIFPTYFMAVESLMGIRGAPIQFLKMFNNFSPFIVDMTTDLALKYFKPPSDYTGKFEERLMLRLPTYAMIAMLYLIIISFIIILFIPTTYY